MKTPVYLKNYHKFQDAIAFDIELNQAKVVDWDESINDKILGHFTLRNNTFFFLYTDGGRLFLRSECQGFNLNDSSTHLSIVTAEGVTYFQAQNENEVLEIEYASWRVELDQDKPDIVSDIVEDDDMTYDFFHYVYALWLDSGLRNQTCQRWIENSEKAFARKA